MTDIFEGLLEKKQELWARLQGFADTLDLSSDDQQVFVGPEQANVAFYINNYTASLISVGIHLARVRRVRMKVTAEKEKFFGSEYVRVTDDCLGISKNKPGNDAPSSKTGSSKFCVSYRTGKVVEKQKYQELVSLEIDLMELEGILESIKTGLFAKSTTLPTLFKLDKQF